MTDRLASPVRVLPRAGSLGEGESVRFQVILDAVPVEAFALRWRGRIYAYLNVCRHQSLPLDFGDGRFLDDTRGAIACCHHGALYEPESGVCAEGPCRGARLTALRLVERPDGLWCVGVARP